MVAASSNELLRICSVRRRANRLPPWIEVSLSLAHSICVWVDAREYHYLSSIALFINLVSRTSACATRIYVSVIAFRPGEPHLVSASSPFERVVESHLQVVCSTAVCYTKHQIKMCKWFNSILTPLYLSHHESSDSSLIFADVPYTTPNPTLLISSSKCSCHVSSFWESRRRRRLRHSLERHWRQQQHRQLFSGRWWRQQQGAERHYAVQRGEGCHQ